jgi:hypothetical protein
MGYLRQLKRDTTSLLAELGESPDQVAASLSRAGVHGVPRDNRTCALALYVSAVLGSEPRVRSVSVGPCSLALSMVTSADRRPAGRLLVQLPKPVRRFVTGFDHGQFPDLVAGPATEAATFAAGAPAHASADART